LAVDIAGNRKEGPEIGFRGKAERRKSSGSRSSRQRSFGRRSSKRV